MRSKLRNKLGVAAMVVAMSSCTFFLEDKHEALNTRLSTYGTNFETTLLDLADKDQLNWIASNEENLFEFDVNELEQSVIKINFLKNKNLTGNTLRITNPDSWDFSQYPDHNVAFDLKNHSDVSLSFKVRIVDVKGGSENRFVAVPANFDGTVYFQMTGSEAREIVGMWGVPKAWDNDDLMLDWLSKSPGGLRSVKLKEIQFKATGLLTDREVQVSNLRIRPNSQRDYTWLEGIVDKFGQSTRHHSNLHVDNVDQLQQVAETELAELEKSGPFADRSKYGGYKYGPKLKATGFFRTQKIDGKWWLVDPDGYVFFSHGPANVRMSNMTTFTGVDFKNDAVRYVDPNEITPEDSIGLVRVSDEVRATKYIASDVRKNMFEWLPSYEDPLSKHYSYRRSSHHGPLKTGETFSFYRANLERRYGENEPYSFIRKWEEVTLDRMNSWGFTSFGNWVDPAFYPNEQVPYFANGWIIGDFKTLNPGDGGWGPIPDVFDPKFAERARATIAVIAEEVKSSPWCIGVFVDNEKSWGDTSGTLKQRYRLIFDALSLNSQDSPAKRVYVQTLIDQYSSIEALNSAWNTDFESWEFFANGVKFNTNTTELEEDLSMMLEMLGNQYFSIVHDTLEEYLPNHLYMGVRMADWGMPEELVNSAVKYSDVLSFNIYDEGVQSGTWDFLEELDLPAVIGEFHIGTVNGSGLYHPGLVSAVDEQDKVRMYNNYMKSVVDHPNFVGAHWFQYIDEPLTGRAYDGENANIGFVNVADIPYPEMVDAVREFNAKLYPDRYGK